MELDQPQPLKATLIHQLKLWGLFQLLRVLLQVRELLMPTVLQGMQLLQLMEIPKLLLKVIMGQLVQALADNHKQPQLQVQVLLEQVQ